MKRICVYCGSSPGGHTAYRDAARRLGTTLVRANLELVYGGGDVGLMGEVANAVLDAGGAAIGVIPEFLVPQVSHRKLTALHVVPSMHERKQMMADLSDGFIALPGGGRDARGSHRSPDVGAARVAPEAVRAPERRGVL